MMFKFKISPFYDILYFNNLKVIFIPYIMLKASNELFTVHVVCEGKMRLMFRYNQGI